MSADTHNEMAMQTRTLIRDAVQAALTAAGFEKGEHNKKLQQVLDITHSAAYRKLTTEAGWSDSDLAAVAAGLQIPIKRLLAAASGVAIDVELVAAKMHINGLVCDCLVQIGGPVSQGAYSEFVAYEMDATGVRHVAQYEEAAGFSNLQRVLRIELMPRQHRPLKVALLEDDRDALEVARIELKQKGLHPVPFRSAEELEAQISSQHFDVIVLDWWIDGVDVGDLIIKIRNSTLNSASSIAVVTGELRAGGNAREDVIEKFITQHKIKTYLKPARWSLLAAEWQANIRV
jgi:CheY-like chemotaxis protein